jgi:UDP-N-acetylglucosamine 2-epimerase (non-hydrolysing)
MDILHVVGARPNFMKAAPVLRALAERPGVRQNLVHTGQHYDENMSGVFFQELGLPPPDVNLEVGSGSHSVQTAAVMTRFERVVLDLQPDLVLVYGDVNSTVAVALVCAKLLVPVGHVEAGLRSFDRTMPEEINRLLTDQISDLLFTPSQDGNDNLLREGVAPSKIHLVGNVMIDTLVRLLPAVSERWPRLQNYLGLDHDGSRFERFALVTLHRPSNVDDPQTLQGIVHALHEISKSLPVIFPVHPRTRQRLQSLAPSKNGTVLRLVEPLGYLDFLAMQQRATVVITDSGGLQEETTFLKVPCLTLRANTERPITVALGTNIMVGNDLAKLQQEVARIAAGNGNAGRIPPLWDGRAGQRIADIIVSAQTPNITKEPEHAYV